MMTTTRDLQAEHDTGALLTQAEEKLTYLLNVESVSLQSFHCVNVIDVGKIMGVYVNESSMKKSAVYVMQRHSDPDQCVVGAVARYLFLKFTDGLPDLTCLQNWDNAIIFGKQKANEAYTVKVPDIRCGDVDLKTLGEAYASLLHQNSAMGLLREQIRPPYKLSRFIFADAEFYLNEDNVIDGKSVVKGFVDLLLWCREILLQDAVFLPDSDPILQYDVFQSSLFLEYKDRMIAQLQIKGEEENPSQEAQPIVMDSAHQDIINIIQLEHKQTRDKIDQFLKVAERFVSVTSSAARQAEHQSGSSHVMEQLKSVRAEGARKRRASVSQARRFAKSAPPPDDSSTRRTNMSRSATNPDSSSDSESDASSNSEYIPEKTRKDKNCSKTAQLSSPLDTTPEKPIKFSDSPIKNKPTGYQPFLGNTDSVDLLYEEWMNGINGYPSVRELDSIYGPKKWLKDAAGRKRYDRRKIIIDAIKSQHNYKESQPQSAIDNIKLIQRNLSLHKLGEILRK